MLADHTIFTTFVLYLAAVAGVAWMAWRRTNSMSAYILGERRLGAGVGALSAQASDMSGWLLLGLPGYAYASGLEAWWLVFGLFLGTWANWHWLAPRLREATERFGDAHTLPDYLQNRFADSSGMLRSLSALLILCFFLIYTTSGLVAGGKLFASVFGLPYEWAVLTGATVILLYTLFGGFLAVSWTDALQGSLMILALVAVVLLAFAELGGPSAAAEQLQVRNPELLDPFTSASGESLGILAILSLMAWGLGYFGQPHILARFMAIRHQGLMPRARRIALAWVSISLLAAMLIGMLGIELVPNPSDGDAERVFIDLTALLLHPLIAGLALAAILAAIMSTADSQLLVAATALVDDLYRPWLRPNASDRERLVMARLGVLLAGLGATLLALDRDSQVLDLVAYAWAGFGAAFGPVILFSLLRPAMRRESAIAGLLSGGLAVPVWRHLEGGVFDLYELLPAFLLSCLAILLVELRAGRTQRTP